MKDDYCFTEEKMMKMFNEPVEFLGGYRIGAAPYSFQINLRKKPILIHRFFMRICFGFKWIDIKNEK